MLTTVRGFLRIALSALAGTVLGTSAAAAQTTYEVIHAFRNSGQPAGLVQSNGVPYGATQSGLIQASDDNLYGTSYWGGTNGVGTIFRIDSDGNTTTVHSFAYADGANPAASLVQATDGNLYGTATRGGASNLGTIFRMDSSGAVTRLHGFDGSDGKDPRSALIQASDGSLYGTAYSGGANGHGTVYKIDLSGTFTTVHSFEGGADGDGPAAALLQSADGNLYGTTEGGTVFRIDASSNLTTIHIFNGLDGYGPYAALIQASDGNLYGTTTGGGANQAGAIFRIDTFAVFSILHSFDGNDGARPYAPLIQAADGHFYGTTSRGSSEYDSGTIYRIDSSGLFEVLHKFDGTDGWSSETALLQAADGDFYGTATTAVMFVLNQVSMVAGTAFRMDLSGNLTTLHHFGWTDGSNPTAALTEAADGNLYGTTFDGGTNDSGTIFRWEPSGNVTTLHNFDGTDGGPGRIIQASDGNFYGTCRWGGNGNGSFFKLEASGQITVLHAFDGVVNGFPSDVIQNDDGFFYGTTVGGGDGGWGTIFRLDSLGNFNQLWSFDPAVDGAFPTSLARGSGGWLYGINTGGGPGDGFGTLFAVDSSGTAYLLHSFQAGPDGGYPTAAPTYAAGLGRYGTTSIGGDNDSGTVFLHDYQLDLETIYSFSDGSTVTSPLLVDGGLYGETNAAIFKIDEQGLAVLHVFGGIDGWSGLIGLIRASDGSIYGVGPGGPLGNGVIFRLSSTNVAVNEISPTSGPASGGQALDLLGGGFVQGATVTVAGVAGTDVVVLDPVFLYLFTPALSPGTLNDVSIINPGSSPATAMLPNAFFADFVDVPQIDPFHDYVEKIFRNGVTAGCGTGNYCPDDAVTRAQMAVFLLKSKHGSAYVPPSCAGVFGDVLCPSMFADWIEQLAAEGITAGCGGGNYCPTNPVTRAQMAAFLLKAEHGSAYAPPTCTGVFADVACPSLFADWIEQLAAEQITGGCGGGNYCPDNPNTRAQMSAFLVKTFHM